MLIKVSKATWQEIQQEEKARRLSFGRALAQDYYRKNMSLRDIAQARGMNHETVRQYIADACAADEAEKLQ